MQTVGRDLSGPGLAGPEERQGVRRSLRALVGERVPEPYVVQIERTLWQIAPEKVRQGQKDTPLQAIFVSKGLLPPELLNAIHSRRDTMGLDIPSLAIGLCFAACIYPRRFSHLPQTLRAKRLEAFERSFCRAVNGGDIMEHALGGLISLPRPEDRQQLLMRLTAADWEGAESRDERHMGAALYVSTIPDDVLARMWNNCCDDGGMVGFIRDRLNTCPTNITAAAFRGQSSRIDWSAVKDELGHLATGYAHTRLVPSVIGLERRLWERIEHARGSRPEDVKSQLAAEAWQMLWAGLVSGFPYYDFSAHFAGWWVQAIRRIPLHLPNNQPDLLDDVLYGETECEWQDVPQTNSDGDEPRITQELLREVREGFLVTLPTFVAIGGATERQVRDTVIAQTGQRLRGIIRRIRKREFIRDLWQLHFEPRAVNAGQAVEIETIAAMYGVNEDTAYTDSRHFQQRYLAYFMARMNKCDDGTVLRMLDLSDSPSDSRQTREDKEKQRGRVLYVANLSRLASKEDTLFPMYVAFRLLTPVLDGRHNDPLILRTALEEALGWIGTHGSLQALERDLPNRSRREKALIRRTLQLVDWFIREMNEIETTSQLRRYLRRNRGRVQGLRDDLRRMIAEELGPEAIDMLLEPKSPQLRRIFREHKYLFVPVWYLSVIRGRRPAEICEILRVEDADESRQVKTLCEAVTALLQRPPARGISPEGSDAPVSQ